MADGSPPIPAVRYADGPPLLPDLRQVGDPRLRLDRDQEIAGVLNVGDQAQVRSGFLSRVHARPPIGAPQELDGDRPEVHRAKSRGIARRQDLGNIGVRLVRRRQLRFADNPRGVGPVAVVTNLHVVPVWPHRRFTTSPIAPQGHILQAAPKTGLLILIPVAGALTPVCATATDIPTKRTAIGHTATTRDLDKSVVSFYFM